MSTYNLTSKKVAFDWKTDLENTEEYHEYWITYKSKGILKVSLAIYMDGSWRDTDGDVILGEVLAYHEEVYFEPIPFGE